LYFRDLPREGRGGVRRYQQRPQVFTIRVELEEQRWRAVG
jgi:hypothetical protein